MNRLIFGIAFSVLLALPGAAWAGDGETVKVRGQEFDVWPVDDLQARGLDIPTIPRDENAAWHYIEASNAYVELPRELSDALEYAVYKGWPKGQTALADYLKLPGNQRAIETVRLAGSLQQCQMPYFGDPSQSIIAVLLPNLSPMRFLAKLMVADGRRLEAEGRIGDAFERYTAVMTMGEHIAQCHTLIEGLVGIAIWTRANEAAVDAALSRSVPRKHLQAFQSRLNRSATKLPSVNRGLAGERAFGPIMVDELCARPLRVLATMRSLANVTDEFGEWKTSIPQDGWGRLELRIGRLFLPDRAIKRHMDGFYEQVARRAAAGAADAVALDFDDERYLTENIPQWDVVSRGLLPSLSRATLLGERTKAELATTRALVAIRLHMLANNGERPDDLEAIAKKLPESALDDPFSGTLLKYRPEPDGWVVYSIGPDFIDDGGEKGKRWDDLDMACHFPPAPVEPFDEGTKN